MSWLNNSLNTIKGQLTTLAQEVLAETAGPGDDEYRGIEADTRSAVELLADTQMEKEQLDKLCNEKDNEIALLRKQIKELQTKFSDSGGGSGAAGSASTSKSPSRNTNAPTPLEDSWCWEPDNVKSDNDHSSESSSSANGNEMVNITLEEVALGDGTQSSTRKRATNEQNAMQLRRIHQLEDENKQLNLALEELDSQHNVAMQNVLELKTGLQEKLTAITHSYETLEKKNADRFINSELELNRLKKELETLEKQQSVLISEKQMFGQQVTEYEDKLKKSIEGMADLQALLEKKNSDNIELIEKIKAAGSVADKAEEERAELQLKIDQLLKEVAEAKQMKEKKTSESSLSSTGKQSEDEFIVVREGDANSSGPTTPPTKEELKDKIVQLENRVSELTLENGSLALKLRDCEMEKELAATVLRENLQELQTRCEDTETALNAAKTQLEEQQENLEELKEKAAEAIIAQEQLKALSDEKEKIETEIASMKDDMKSVLELEKRLLLAENEKEGLQVELQGLRGMQERNVELERKVQNLIMENQEFRLNAEAETESQNYSAELAERLKSLNEENDNLRAEVLSMAQAKFREAIEEEKQEITDLDADDDEPLTVDKIRELLSSHIKSKLSHEMEEACRAVQERVTRTVNAMERNISRMSEEILDLQDSKIVWDHDKKTLEADISQYIIQCDELMKNNEILLNELENYKRNKLETIHEHNEESVIQLEAQLEESSKLNQSLEEEYDVLNKKNKELEQKNHSLTEQLNSVLHRNDEQHATVKDLKMQLEMLELEKSDLLFQLNEQRSAEMLQTVGVDDALKSAEEKCESLEGQLARLSKDHADLVAAMQTQKAALQDAIKKREQTEKALAEQEILVAHMKHDLKSLKDERERADRVQRQANELATFNQQLKQELLAKEIVAENQKKELQAAQQRLSELEVITELKQTLEQQLADKEGVLLQLQSDLAEKATHESKLLTELQRQTANAEQLVQLKHEKEALVAEFVELKKKCEAHTVELKALQESVVTSTSSDASAITRIAQLEAELLATADLQKAIDSLSYEKSELIKALQQKHAENMQYYMEIQRLQPLVQLLQQQVEERPCDKCTTQESTLSELRKELEKQQDQIKFLKEKSDILTTNLLTEQTNQRLVQEQKADVEEQNVAIRKDLERLRAHLLEIEDMHTQETMDLQRELEETTAKMVALQDEVAKSSNAYTSASIRANQHAETLHAQYALVLQQRDELVNKLSSADDRESKSQAALCNLQCALEQFQNDKENDIKAATHGIRKELQLGLAKHTQLQAEIGALQQKLTEANQGLSAAARLSDQLEACQRTIAALRDEVEAMKQQNEQLAVKLNTSESSQTDKIDKCLIKSLLIGYVVSNNPNDKNQVLRMISSVLDFTQSESDKVGLNKQQSSWLGAILGGGTGAQGLHSKDSLAEAFVQFLEQESQPKADPNNMPNLLNITQQNSPTGATDTGNQPARRISTSSNNSSTSALSLAPLPIQPMLLNEFAPTRNSSSILKDILSDS